MFRNVTYNADDFISFVFFPDSFSFIHFSYITPSRRTIGISVFLFFSFQKQQGNTHRVTETRMTNL